MEAQHPSAACALSVVVPCFDEEAVLGEFYRRMASVCVALPLGYEVVLVDDGSRDRTWELMTALAQRDPRVVCVKLSRNHGHQLALSAGLSVCRGERVLIIDGDLQDPPELLPRMLEIMEAGADVVYGQRRLRAGESPFKLWTARAFYRTIEKLTETPIPRDTGDFRLMSRRALDVLLAMPERRRFIRGMVSWIGFRQEPLLYDRDARLAGESKYPLRKMLRFAIDAVTAFSTKPLALASLLGLAWSAVALLLVVYWFVSWVALGAASGWTGLAALVSLLGGMQLIVLGIIGEYLGRLFEQSKGRPLFIIETIVSRSATAAGAASSQAILSPATVSPSDESLPGQQRAA